MKVLKTVVHINGYDIKVLDWPVFSEQAARDDVLGGSKDQSGCISRRYGDGPYMTIVVCVDEDVYAYTLHTSEMGQSC